jgi:Spy/CpxP family protein refolding chaperone
MIRSRIVSFAVASVLVLAALGYGFAANAKASQPEPGQTPSVEGKAKHKGGCMAKFSETLGLTDAQKEQISALKAEKKSWSGLTKEEKRAMCAEMKAKIESLLTPEQRAKLAELKAEWKQKKALWKQQGHAKQKAA